MASSKADLGAFDMTPSYRRAVARGPVGPLALLVGTLLLPAAARAEGPLPFTAEELVKKIAEAQGRVDRSLADWVFDQVEVRTDYGKDGRPKETRRRLFHYFSGDRPGQASRELVEVDGRPATEEEKAKVAREDAKQQRKQDEREAERHAEASRNAAAARLVTMPMARGWVGSIFLRSAANTPSACNCAFSFS